MDFRVFDSLDHYLPTQRVPAYFSREYLSIQDHQQIIIAEDDFFLVLFSIKGQTAESISKSPFGAFWVKKSFNEPALDSFQQSLINALRRRKVTKVEIRQSPSLYAGFVDSERLSALGYTEVFEDINQHIPLSSNWQDEIHTMQRRKLKSLREEGFEFKVSDDLKIIYQFIKVCRQTQGLEINITWEHLEKLKSQLPEKYTCFVVERSGRIAAVCIAVTVTDEVAYYYLPATSPLFRTQSPMVLLLAGMVDYYRSKGFKYLDLGVSSIEGKPQETLILFKERMGGIVTKKPFFTLSI